MRSKQTSVNDQLLGNRAQLASLMDCSMNTLAAYESKGLIVKVGAKFDLLATTTSVVKYLRSMAGNTSSGDKKEQKLDEEIRQLRLDNAKKEGELVPIEDVHKIVRKALVSTADWMEGLPDAFESTGIISSGMTDEFIRVLDNQREVLLNMVFAEIDDDKE